MSNEKARAEAARWLATAIEDLDASRILAENGKFSHACFLCQQAAEKSIKALYYRADEDPWGHSVYKLLAGLEETYPSAYESLAEHLDAGRFLDKLYIPTRYPNGLPDILPATAYSGSDAREAYKYAKGIIDAVETLLGKS